MESTKSVYELFSYNKISVNSKGKIVDDAYLILNGAHTLMESSTAYLKNLKYVETKYFREENGTTNHYVIILKCNDGSNCISRIVKTRDEVKPSDQIVITIYTMELSEKVKSAIIHLLDLGNKSPNFLTKDIF